MKIAILSDFHLGYDRFVEDAYKQAEEALTKASALADMMILPGDLFDIRNPRLEILAQGVNLFRNVARKKWVARVVAYSGNKTLYTDIPIIAIPGTHERRAQNAGNSVELLSLAGLLIDASDATVEVEKDGEKVCVFSLGGLSEEKVKETLKELNPTPIEGAFNVFQFHQSIYELLPFSNDFIKFDDLPKGFDLYIDGHIHNKVESKVFGKPFLIPGSTVLTQLKDGEQEQKGFFLFDTKTKSYEFIPIESREFFVEKIDVHDKDVHQIQVETEQAIERLLKKSKERPVIRIVLEGDLKHGYKNVDIDMVDILKRYKERAVLEVSKNKIDDVHSHEEIDSLRNGTLENVSIKDYGLSIFIEQLKKSDYSLGKSPTELFEMLSSDQKKEKVMAEIMEMLFSKS